MLILADSRSPGHSPGIEVAPVGVIEDRAAAGEMVHAEADFKPAPARRMCLGVGGVGGDPSGLGADRAACPSGC